MATELKRLSEELRPIVGKYRKVFNPIELATAVSEALIAEAKERPDRALDRAVARGLTLREEAKQEEGGHISADQAARMLASPKLASWRSSRRGNCSDGERQNRRRCDFRFGSLQEARF
jgi:hypothetical protein